MVKLKTPETEVSELRVPKTVDTILNAILNQLAGVTPPFLDLSLRPIRKTAGRCGCPAILPLKMTSRVIEITVNAFAVNSDTSTKGIRFQKYLVHSPKCLTNSLKGGKLIENPAMRISVIAFPTLPSIIHKSRGALKNSRTISIVYP